MRNIQQVDRISSRLNSQRPDTQFISSYSTISGKTARARRLMVDSDPVPGGRHALKYVPSRDAHGATAPTVLSPSGSTNLADGRRADFE
jgi:hypothetical protein